MWLKHVESSTPPEMPKKLGDETWSRMSITQRTEYELSVSKAQECLNKYIRLGDLLKKRAGELLRKVLCMQPGWLVPTTFDTNERAKELASIREKYLCQVASMLITIHARSGEQMEVLHLSTLLVDPQYGLDRALGKESLRKLISLIGTTGGAALFGENSCEDAIS